jgi:hypothetical protein
MGVVSTVLHLSADNLLSMPGFPVHVNAKRIVSWKVRLHRVFDVPDAGEEYTKEFLDRRYGVT